MPQHKCEVCKYSSSRLADLTRHKSTKKHISNTENVLKENIKTLHKIKSESNISDSDNSISEDDDKQEVFVCKFCNKIFNHAPSKCRHEKHYCKKRNNNLMTNSNEVLELKQQVKSLMELVASTVDIMKDNTHLANKSVSTTSYVVKHFNKAPPIKKLENKKAIKLLEYNVPKNYTSGDVIIFKHKHHILHKYLGDIIIDEYKTAKPEDQSFWNSDSVRLSFIVREVLKSGDDEWITDKSGIKLTNLIISPMLDSVKEVMKEYVDTQIKLINDREDDTELTTNMAVATDVIFNVNKSILHDAILKYIAPHFDLAINKFH